MKKAAAGLALAMLLTGCGAADRQMPPETLAAVPYEQQEKPTAGEIGIWIPEKAIAQTVAEDSGVQVYSWEDYELRMETVDGGDIHRTLKQLTGIDYENLTVMCRKRGTLELYQTVWCAAGEDGTVLGRAIVADDGNYHYCVSLLAPESADSSEIYDKLYATMAVTDGESHK